MKKTLHRKSKHSKSKRKLRRKTHRIKKMKGGEVGFDTNISSKIQNARTIQLGKDTTQTEFHEIDQEILDYVIKCEDNKGEGAAPIAFLDESIDEYQDKSYFINGFLRDNVKFYVENGLFYLFNMFKEYVDIDTIKWYIIRKTNDKIDKIDKINKINKTISDYLPLEIRDKIKKISAMDYLFNHSKCPKFANQTVLYRGTDQIYHYRPTFNDPAFVSTTKTVETLFTVSDKFIDKKKKCCIHVFLIDQGVPYIDLEKENSTWSYQKEVLLPRGLVFNKISTGTYTNDDGVYNAFLYKVSLPSPSSLPVVYNADDKQAIVSLVNKVIKKINDVSNVH